MPNIAKQGSYIEFTSLTKQINDIPIRLDNILMDLGLVTTELLNTDTVVIPRLTVKDYKYGDVAWGSKAQVNLNNSKGTLTLPIPAFAVTDSITPLDIRGKYNWDDIVAANRPETVQSMMFRKMETARQAWANTWSEALMQLVREGTAYAPNGTLATSYGATINYYTEFGVTRTDKVVTLSNLTANPKAEVKEIIREIQDNYKGGTVPTRFLGLADRGFFDDLEQHPYVVDGMKTIINGQSLETVLGRLGVAGLNLTARYEVLDFGSVVWVCVPNGYMTTDEARVFPVDVPDMFKIFHAPSLENFDVANAIASPVYYYEYMSDRRDSVIINHESNFLCATTRPKSIVRVTKA